MRISDWSSDVCSSDLGTQTPAPPASHVDISIGMLRHAAAGMPAWRRPSAGARTPPRHTAFPGYAGDRQRVVQGKSVSVRVDLGGRRIIKIHTDPKNNRLSHHHQYILPPKMTRR